MNQRFVIVGSSAAGIAAATELRRLDQSISITVLGAESGLPYNKCRLVDFIAGSIQEHELFLRTADWFVENKIVYLPDDPVTSLDEIRCTVTTASGICYSFDKLLIASGMKPRHVSNWPIAENFVSFYTLQDAHKLQRLLAKNPRKAVIIGAGLTGLEVADALRAKGCQVTVFDRGDRLLPHHLTPKGSAFLQHFWADRVLTYMSSISVVEFKMSGSLIQAVITNDGSYFETDLVIGAAGTEPNEDYFSNLGLVKQKGLLQVTDLLQTSHQAIWAAGDAIVIPCRASKTVRPSVLWADAIQQGISAAQAMMSKSVHYEGSFFTTATVLAGKGYLFGGNLYAQNVVIESKTTETWHVEMALNNDRLVGYASLGDFPKKGELRRLLYTQQPVNIATYF